MRTVRFAAGLVLGLVLAAQAGSLKIAFVTDIHARTEWDTPLALEKAAAAINAEQPDLIVGGGDYITEGFESPASAVAVRWEVFRSFQQALEARLEPAMGNHDLVAARPSDGSPPAPDPRAIFRQFFGLESPVRSFDFEGVHFMFLDPIVITRDRGLPYRMEIPDEQVEWIRQDLEGVARSTPIVLVSHAPLRSGQYREAEEAGSAPPPNRVVVNHQVVLDLFYQHRLVLVLQGHLHVEEVLREGGITFITGGAVCGQWWRGPWQGTPEGFGVATLEEGGVAWRYVPYGWKARRPAGQ